MKRYLLIRPTVQPNIPIPDHCFNQFHICKKPKGHFQSSFKQTKGMNFLKLKKRNLQKNTAIILAGFGITSKSKTVYELMQKEIKQHFLIKKF